jgi:hypothetical protein
MPIIHPPERTRHFLSRLSLLATPKTYTSGRTRSLVRILNVPTRIASCCRLWCATLPDTRLKLRFGLRFGHWGGRSCIATLVWQTILSYNIVHTRGNNEDKSDGNVLDENHDHGFEECLITDREQRRGKAIFYSLSFPSLRAIFH